MNPAAGLRVVFIGGSWCVPCKKFLPTVRAVCEARGVPLEVLSMDGAEGLKRPDPSLRVSAVPTLLVLDATGREIRRSSGGTMSPQALGAWLTSGGL